MPQLTVHNAQMSTATVEIKTLTITGKQVTLAVFRQLIEEDLIAEDGTLDGIPWGTVNYHPDKCGTGDYWKDHPHWHVVWQKGGELRRSLVRTQYAVPYVFWSKALPWHYAACVHHWLATGEVRYWQGGIFSLFSGELKGRYGGKITDASGREGWINGTANVDLTDEETGIGVRFGIPQEVKTAALARSGVIAVRETRDKAAERVAEKESNLEDARRDLAAIDDPAATPEPTDHSDPCWCVQCYHTSPQRVARRVQDAESYLAEATESAQEISAESFKATAEAKATESAALAVLRDYYAAEPLEQLWAEYRAELADEAARRERHVSVRKAIADLPQLFIAV